MTGRNIGACFLILLILHAQQAAAQAIFYGGMIFYSQEAVDKYRLRSDLNDCSDTHFYTGQQTAAPLGIAATLAQSDKSTLTFRTCVDAARNVHYFVREPMAAAVNHYGPSLTGHSSFQDSGSFRDGGTDPLLLLPAGVCRVSEYEVFPDDKAGTGWSDRPPQSWQDAGYASVHTELGMVTPGRCPAPDDPDYFIVHTIPNGLLKAFVDLWRTSIASSAAFNRALPPSAVKGRCIWFPPDYKPGGQKLGPGFCAQMREQFRSIAQDGHTRFATIGCEPVAGSCSAQLGKYDIGFEVTDNGVRVTSLSYHWEMVT